MDGLSGVPLDKVHNRLMVAGEIIFVNVPGLDLSGSDEDVVKAINKKNKKKKRAYVYAKVGDQYLRIPVGGKVSLVNSRQTWPR